MGDEGSKLKGLLGDIVQVGIVVDDMEKAKKGMKIIFGLDPSAESDNLYKETWYKGNLIEAPVKAAFYNQFNIQLELLQPVGDTDTIWHDFLKEGYEIGGHSLHHLRFDVANNDQISEEMKKLGIAKYMEGRSLVDPTATFTYFDSVETVGFVIEVVTKSKVSKL